MWSFSSSGWKFFEMKFFSIKINHTHTYISMWLIESVFSFFDFFLLNGKNYIHKNNVIDLIDSIRFFSNWIGGILFNNQKNLPPSNFLTNKHFPFLIWKSKKKENLIDWFSIGHNFSFVSRLLQKTKNRKKNRYELEIDLGPERVETNRQNLEQQKYGISKQNRKNFQITCFVVVILSSSLFHFFHFFHFFCLLDTFISQKTTTTSTISTMMMINQKVSISNYVRMMYIFFVLLIKTKQKQNSPKEKLPNKKKRINVPFLFLLNLLRFFC